jgi:hypothetical protein
MIPTSLIKKSFTSYEVNDWMTWLFCFNGMCKLHFAILAIVDK